MWLGGLAPAEQYGGCQPTILHTAAWADCVDVARRLRAAGQHGGFFSRLCRSGGFAPLGSMAASSADYTFPAASRCWAAWRLL